MKDVRKIARYLYVCYFKKISQKIDEMKMHKLLYFMQRESLIETDKPLFEAQFHAWKYGPVLIEVREMYKNGVFRTDDVVDVDNTVRCVADRIFEKYAEKESWSLSNITHAEISWLRARKRDKKINGQNSNAVMTIEDIRMDAQRVKERRKSLAEGIQFVRNVPVLKVKLEHKTDKQIKSEGRTIGQLFGIFEDSEYDKKNKS